MEKSPLPIEQVPIRCGEQWRSNLLPFVANVDSCSFKTGIDGTPVVLFELYFDLSKFG